MRCAQVEELLDASLTADSHAIDRRRLNELSDFFNDGLDLFSLFLFDSFLIIGLSPRLGGGRAEFFIRFFNLIISFFS